MIARQSKKQQGISLAAIALMMVLAQSNLIDVYADHMMWIAAAIPSTALGTAIAFAGTRYSLTIWWQLTFLALAQFIIGPVIALPSTTIAHVIPSLDTLSQGWEMTFGAFKYLISVAPPVGTAYGSLMAVWTIGLWLAFLAGTFAISDHAWTSAIAAIPLATAMAVCALLGTYGMATMVLRTGCADSCSRAGRRRFRTGIPAPPHTARHVQSTAQPLRLHQPVEQHEILYQGSSR